MLVPPSCTAAQDVEFTPDWYMVVDRANLLDEGQERSAIDDAWRLNTIGTPTQVVTELMQSTPELASQRATELRIANAIESAPGADDGVLIYAAVNPGDRSRVDVAISVGLHAVPRGGFTETSPSDIRNDIIEPQLQAGHPARAIVYSLGEIHYLQVFTPPPVAPLEGWRSTLHTIMQILAPFVAVVTAAMLAVHTRPGTLLRKEIVSVVLACLIAFGLAAVSMVARSPVGALSALALLAVAIWTVIHLDRGSGAVVARRLTVTPRPPGGMQTLRRTTPR
jgi:hypothetical protein